MMEGGPFLSRNMQREFSRFVMVELHTDGRGEEFRESSERNREIQRENYGTAALPYYVLLDPSGRKVYWQGGGPLSEEEFIAKLKSVPQPSK